MEDKELLERAAKASGHDDSYLDDRKRLGDEWNPLVDDGDAFRLAVKLKILVDPDGSQYAAVDKRGGSYAHATATRDGKRYSEPHGDSAASAVRRAIVRAAANDKE